MGLTRHKPRQSHGYLLLFLAERTRAGLFDDESALRPSDAPALGWDIEEV